MNIRRDSLAKTNGGTGNRAATYDSRGNVDRLGGQYFSYDATNRPSSITSDVEATYRYDGLCNLRLMKRMSQKMNEESSISETLYTQNTRGRRVRTVLWKDEGYVIRYNVYGASGNLIFKLQIEESLGGTC